MRAQRQHRLAILGIRHLADSPQHLRLARSVDIRIEHPDRRPFCGKGKRKIGRYGRFAHATLARRHGNHVPDAGNGLEISLHGMAHYARRQLDFTRLQARFRANCGRYLLMNCAVRTVAGKPELDGCAEYATVHAEIAKLRDLCPGGGQRPISRWNLRTCWLPNLLTPSHFTRLH